MNEEQTMNINRDYRMELVRKNTEYYSRKFAYLDSNQRKTSWNWLAFFLPFAWFAYRKLYLECIAYYILVNGLNWSVMTILQNCGTVANAGWIIDVTTMIFSGLYANWLYKLRLERHVQKLVAMPEERREKYLKKHGGTSVMAIIVAFAISIAIAAVLYYTFL